MIKQKLNNFTSKIKIKWQRVPESVRIAITIFLVVLPLWILAAIFKKFLGNFGEGLLIEAFGMLLDILVVLIVFQCYNEKREKRRRIERWQEEIDDFRGWKSDEAMYRIVGNLKRLRRESVDKISLRDCYLVGAKLRDMDLKGVYFGFANLSRAVFVNSDLRKVSFWGANLSNALLTQAKLQYAFLTEADLTGAILVSTNLENAKIKNSAVVTRANFREANLRNVDFRRCDLRGAIDLNIDQLSQVKTLYEAQLDPELLEQVNLQYPHLRERPEDEEGESDGE